MKALVLVAALLGVAGACARAQDDLPGDPEAGHALAREVCALCHVVDADQTEIPATLAPAFPELVQDPAVTEMSLRVFFQTPHQQMPDLMLTPEETDDMIAYLLALKGE